MLRTLPELLRISLTDSGNVDKRKQSYVCICCNLSTIITLINSASDEKVLIMIWPAQRL